ncbi:hypothetical protein F5148DRAFT_1369606 [Russula earlei]|uniref:Uncharacterized protein n=1 Tax=Russula earlei TaxID=71964 RepID=A0ACC0U2K6_9AGAM|nr:hypothetical protein F5148DRAFT_1369606 [Russula earlei]
MSIPKRPGDDSSHSPSSSGHAALSNSNAPPTNHSTSPPQSGGNASATVSSPDDDPSRFAMNASPPVNRLVDPRSHAVLEGARTPPHASIDGTAPPGESRTGGPATVGSSSASLRVSRPRDQPLEAGQSSLDPKATSGGRQAAAQLAAEYRASDVRRANARNAGGGPLLSPALAAVTEPAAVPRMSLSGSLRQRAGREPRHEGTPDAREVPSSSLSQPVTRPRPMTPVLSPQYPPHLRGSQDKDAVRTASSVPSGPGRGESGGIHRPANSKTDSRRETNENENGSGLEPVHRTSSVRPGAQSPFVSPLPPDRPNVSMSPSPPAAAPLSAAKTVSKWTRTSIGTPSNDSQARYGRGLTDPPAEYGGATLVPATQNPPQWQGSQENSVIGAAPLGPSGPGRGETGERDRPANVNADSRRETSEETNASHPEQVSRTPSVRLDAKSPFVSPPPSDKPNISMSQSPPAAASPPVTKSVSKWTSTTMGTPSNDSQARYVRGFTDVDVPAVYGGAASVPAAAAPSPPLLRGSQENGVIGAAPLGPSGPARREPGGRDRPADGKGDSHRETSEETNASRPEQQQLRPTPSVQLLARSQFISAPPSDNRNVSMTPSVPLVAPPPAAKIASTRTPVSMGTFPKDSHVSGLTDTPAEYGGAASVPAAQRPPHSRGSQENIVVGTAPLGPSGSGRGEPGGRDQPADAKGDSHGGTNEETNGFPPEQVRRTPSVQSPAKSRFNSAPLSDSQNVSMTPSAPLVAPPLAAKTAPKRASASTDAPSNDSPARHARGFTNPPAEYEGTASVPAAQNPPHLRGSQETSVIGTAPLGHSGPAHGETKGRHRPANNAKVDSTDENEDGSGPEQLRRTPSVSPAASVPPDLSSHPPPSRVGDPRNRSSSPGEKDASGPYTDEPKPFTTPRSAPPMSQARSIQLLWIATQYQPEVQEAARRNRVVSLST